MSAHSIITSFSLCLWHSLLTSFTSLAFGTWLQLVGGCTPKPPLSQLRYCITYISTSVIRAVFYHNQTHTICTSVSTGIYILLSYSNTSELSLGITMGRQNLYGSWVWVSRVQVRVEILLPMTWVWQVFMGLHILNVVSLWVPMGSHCPSFISPWSFAVVFFWHGNFVVHCSFLHCSPHLWHPTPRHHCISSLPSEPTLLFIYPVSVHYSL